MMLTNKNFILVVICELKVYFLWSSWKAYMNFNFSST